jgi:hypothetical protein
VRRLNFEAQAHLSSPRPSKSRLETPPHVRARMSSMLEGVNSPTEYLPPSMFISRVLLWILWLLMAFFPVMAMKALNMGNSQPEHVSVSPHGFS